ncbi:MAG: DUF4276 family protein [Sulfurovum sp.]
MSEFLTIGLHAEGPTDHKLLKHIIRRTVEDIILNCDKDIEINPIIEIDKISGSYNQNIEHAAKEAFDSGIKCLILHCDADKSSIDHVMCHKITPAIETIHNHTEKTNMCSNLIPLVPIYMSEAWMLSDIELLKQEIGAERIDNATLGLTRSAESYADPKATLVEAIRISQASKSRRHRNFNISDLYIPLGQKTPLTKLKQLSSYQQFYTDLKSICLPYC